jgi:hypothetical protein
MAIERKKIISEVNTYTYCFKLSEIISFFESKIDRILEHMKDYNKIDIKIENVDYYIVTSICELYKSSGWNVSYKFCAGSSDLKERDYYILTFN